jgi:hypothetical protein
VDLVPEIRISLFRIVGRSRQKGELNQPTNESTEPIRSYNQSWPRPLNRPIPALSLPTTMFLFLLILIFLSPSFAQSFRLYHRLFHPSLPEQNFVKRGSIIEDVDGKFRVQSLSSTLQHQLPLAETSEHVTDVLYQLALDPGKTDSLWLISSVKAVNSPLIS